MLIFLYLDMTNMRIEDDDEFEDDEDDEYDWDDEEVDDEDQLERQHDEQRDCRQDTQVLEARLHQFGEITVVVDPAMLSRSSEHEQWEENQIEGNDGPPEMNLPPGIIHHPAEHLRKPVRDPHVEPDDGNWEERVVEMR